MTMRVLGLLALAFLFSQGERLPAYAQQPPVRADNGSVAVGGNVSNSTIIIGYTIEQHEQRLKAREQELRELHQAQLGQSEERRKTVERELQGVQGQLGNLQKSYEERVTELKRTAGELEALRGQVPDAKLQEALDALGQGKTKLADALFAEVENREQQGIERAARAAFERGRIAYQEVRWQDARSHFEKADRLVPDHTDYSNWAARLTHDLGDYSTATRRYAAIYDRVRKEEGEDAREMSIASNNLAMMYRAQGRYGEAEPLLKKSIAIDEKALPADHPDLAIWYNNLAELYRAQGRYGKAEPLHKKATAIFEKALPADDPTLAINYNNLAGLYQSLGRYGKAEPLYKRAIAIGETALPADHPHLAIWYNNLAGLYRDQGRSGEAQALLKKALEIRVRKLGLNHPDTIATSKSLATLLRSEADAPLKGIGPRMR
jgi:tetratricopeptide (TPR) repeat protein